MSAAAAAVEAEATGGAGAAATGTQPAAEAAAEAAVATAASTMRGGRCTEHPPGTTKNKPIVPSSVGWRGEHMQETNEKHAPSQGVEILAVLLANQRSPRRRRRIVGGGKPTMDEHRCGSCRMQE